MSDWKHQQLTNGAGGGVMDNSAGGLMDNGAGSAGTTKDANLIRNSNDLARDKRTSWRRSQLTRGTSLSASFADYEPESLTEFLTEFAVNTSAHGIPRVGGAKSITGRLVWALVFLLCFGMFTYQMYWVVEKYLRNEKIVNIELSFEKVPFPAVTLCNVNPYKSSLLSKNAELAKTMEVFERAKGSTSHGGAGGDSSRVKRARAHNPQFKPVLANCECEKDDKIDANDCKPILHTIPAGNDSTCVCTFDRVSDAVWPCYPLFMWEYDHCQQCSLNGYCTKRVQQNDRTDDPNSVACICQTITNYCVKLVNGADLLNLWEIMTTTTTTTTTPAPTTTEDPGYLEALGFEGMTDEVAIVTRAKENLVFSTAGLPIQQRIALSYAKHEIIWKCSFNGQQCDIDLDFKLHVDPVYGNCYTFNHEKKDMKRSSRAGPMYGLRVFMYINVTDFLQTSETKGVRIAIHNQTEMPFPDSYGFAAPTGFTSSFGIKMKQMNRLPKPYGDCVKDGRSDDYIFTEYDYSPEGCYRTCFQRQLTAKCGCGDPRFPPLPGTQLCKAENSESRSCLEELTKGQGLGSSGNCDCGNPCDQSIFSVSFSAAKWPSGSSKPSDCPDELTKEECIDMYRENAAMVEIYYEQLNYETLKESEAYGIVNLLADFGGQLGLWMGISVITCAEFFVLIWDMMKFIFLRLRNREHQSSAKKNKEKRQEELRMEEKMMELKQQNRKHDRQNQFAAHHDSVESAYFQNDLKLYNNNNL